MRFPFSSKQKVPFVCLSCRVGLKTIIPFYFEECGDERRPVRANAKCPRCKKQTVYLGRYFKIPPQNAPTQWRKAELLWRSGWVADGCSGGPKTLREAHEFVRAPDVQTQRRVLQQRAKTEEHWRKIRLRLERSRRR